MHLARPRQRLTGAIPTASMADIAFLLIIFFMVTTAYSLDRSAVELPETSEQQQAPKGAALVVITADGAFRFSAGEKDAEAVKDLDGLTEAIRQTAAANRLHPFTIKADRSARYRTIDAVLEQLRLAGAENITLLSRGEGAR